MKPITHPSNNLTLNAPADHDNSAPGALQVDPLRATRFYHDNSVFTQTFWLPEPEELAAIAAGHPIMITTVGMSFPPMMVQVSAELPVAGSAG